MAALASPPTTPLPQAEILLLYAIIGYCISFGKMLASRPAIVNGPVHTEFHCPPSKVSREPESIGANGGPVPKRAEDPPKPTIVIPVERDADFVERGGGIGPCRAKSIAVLTGYCILFIY